MIVKNDREFQEKVCERDKWVCQYCRKSFNYPMYFDEKGKNQYVCAHHVASKKAYPELRFETDNGKTICKDCHLPENNKI